MQQNTIRHFPDINLIRGFPIIGKSYKVPCVVEEKLIVLNDYEDEPFHDDNIFDRDGHAYIRSYTPIIDHFHTDRENGQNHGHYHVDFRFIPPMNKDIKYQYKVFGHLLNWAPLRLNSEDHKDHFKITTRILRCYNSHHTFLTGVTLIGRSKIKHDCIHKGKCPHRGYDLSNAVPNKEGIIQCPLHSLKFDGITKKLVPELQHLVSA